MDFEKCKGQFAEAGLVPSDREEFPGFEKALDSLSTEEERTTKRPA